MLRVFAFIIAICCYIFHEKKDADLIVHNAIVYTVDSAFSTKEAFAVKDGKIIDVSSNADVLDNYTSANIIDAKRKAVYPGFIDAHAHFLEYAQSLFSVDLYNKPAGDSAACTAVCNCA